MPKGIHNGKRGRKSCAPESKLHATLVYLPKEVKDNLTPSEKRSALIDAHKEKMSDLDAWCDKMLTKLKQ